MHMKMSKLKFSDFYSYIYLGRCNLMNKKRKAKTLSCINKISYISQMIFYLFKWYNCRHHQHGRWQARIGRVAGNKDLYL